MSDILFSGVTHVEIQGERALRLVAIEDECAEFEVIGFEDPKIAITDFRTTTVSALRSALETENLEFVAESINLPAEAKIRTEDSGRIEVELLPTTIEDPPYRLWIPIGIGKSIPVFAYLIKRIVPFDEERHAMFALYHRDYQKAYELSEPSAISW
jgi:hypothetical protein